LPTSSIRGTIPNYQCPSDPTLICAPSDPLSTASSSSDPRQVSPLTPNILLPQVFGKSSSVVSTRSSMMPEPQPYQGGHQPQYSLSGRRLPDIPASPKPPSHAHRPSYTSADLDRNGSVTSASSEGTIFFSRALRLQYSRATTVDKSNPFGFPKPAPSPFGISAPMFPSVDSGHGYGPKEDDGIAIDSSLLSTIAMRLAIRSREARTSRGTFLIGTLSQDKT